MSPTLKKRQSPRLCYTQRDKLYEISTSNFVVPKKNIATTPLNKSKKIELKNQESLYDYITEGDIIDNIIDYNDALKFAEEYLLFHSLNLPESFDLNKALLLSDRLSTVIQI